MPECDRSFKRDLKNLDRRLGTKFNGEHFVVTYDRGYGEPVNIYRVKSDDDGFRQPDQRDLKIIKGGDLAVGDRMEMRLKKMAYASEVIRRETRRRVKDEIRNRLKDSKHQLTRWVGDRANISKSNAEFRRVPHKPGKNVVATT